MASTLSTILLFTMVCCRSICGFQWGFKGESRQLNQGKMIRESFTDVALQQSTSSWAFPRELSAWGISPSSSLSAPGPTCVHPTGSHGNRPKIPALTHSFSESAHVSWPHCPLSTCPTHVSTQDLPWPAPTWLRDFLSFCDDCDFNFC